MKKGLVFFKALEHKLIKREGDTEIDSIVNEVNSWHELGFINSSDDFRFIICIHEPDDYDATKASATTGHVYEFGLQYQYDILPTIHYTRNNKGVDVNLFSCNVNGARRYWKIMDSSIWNYYYTSEKDIFLNALKAMAYNYDKGLYELDVSHEYADLCARLLKQSYLNGSHDKVSPFLFHSEHDMKDKIDKFVFDKKKGTKLKVEIKKYLWRFLLLDDNSIELLDCNESDKKGKVNKLQIIKENINRVLGFENKKIWFRNIIKVNDNLKINGCGSVNNEEWDIIATPTSLNDVEVVIDCVPNLDSALACMKTNEYEVILLDYLLSNNMSINEFGYSLLNKFYVDNKDFCIGPNKRCFFMFISAYTTAVHERMLEQGINKSEPRLWYIGDGACPTNTPNLFSYQLLLLMQHRLTDLKKDKEGGHFTIIDLLEVIYDNKNTFDMRNVREKAYSHFSHLLFMRDKYKKLEDDLSIDDEKHLKEYPNDMKHIMNMKSSLLVYSAFKVVHHFSEAFFDHLQHLVYLTAFGTIRQWQDMWEEYEFVYKELYEYDNYVVDNEGKKHDRGKKICNAIKEYIINLKENSI